ncbi:MAG TPA: alpha/beta hydrolase [Caldilineaceae bacterium]|nr:alpha/beta hydrolase [Caldilineaceae bacterium]
MNKQRNSRPARANPVGSLFGGLIRLGVMAAGGWIAYSYLGVNHHMALPKAIPAEQTVVGFRPTGSLNLYHDRQGDGPPLLLIHSINAAASAYEMRPLFQHYRGRRPVFALDLPGFGFSTRADVTYTPALFVKAILAALDEIGSRPVDVVALSLSSEFAAEAARQQPTRFRSLALISPTGFDNASADKRRYSGLLQELLTVPLWARPLYDLIATRRSIEYFLQKSFVGPVPPDYIDYCYATAHQPGAEHAPLAFISGRLFTPNAVDAIYAAVQTPALVIYDRDAFVTFDRLPGFVEQHPSWRVERITPTCGLPHFERLEETAQVLDRFWQSLG